MAKVKWSQADPNRQSSGKSGGNSDTLRHPYSNQASTPAGDQPLGDAADQTQGGTVPEVPGQGGATPVRDSRDVTIRTLQIALGAVSVIAVGLIVALVILVVRPVGSSAPHSSTSVAVAPSASAAPTPLFLSHYIDAEPGTAKPGAIIVDIHDDYQCPWCGRAEQIYGDALGQLAESGDIDLRIHIRTMVGDQIIHNDSSERAGIAAVCASEVGDFWSYHQTVFANQPSEGTGYTDDQLRNTFAAQAGITGQNLTTFQNCYDTKATASQVTAMEQEADAAGINSTPSFYVNGIKVNFDLQSSATTVTPMSAADLLTALKSVS